jgi:hypothetical protein
VKRGGRHPRDVSQNDLELLSCALIQGGSIGITTLRLVEKSKIVQNCCNIGMIGSEYLFLNRQRPLVRPPQNARLKAGSTIGPVCVGSTTVEISF